MQSRAVRVLRGVAAASFATFAAAVSHVIAGGVPASLFGVTVSLVLATGVCTLLAGRTVSFFRLTIAILISQAMYHTLFSSLLAPEGIVSHNMATMSVNFASAPHTAHSAMTLAHFAAAALTIVVFRYAEVAFWGLLTTAQLFMARLLAVHCPISRLARKPLPARRSARAATMSHRFLATVRYRGPPAATFAV